MEVPQVQDDSGRAINIFANKGTQMFHISAEAKGLEFTRLTAQFRKLGTRNRFVTPCLGWVRVAERLLNLEVVLASPRPTPGSMRGRRVRTVFP